MSHAGAGWLTSKIGAMSTPNDERRLAARQVLRTKAQLLLPQGLVMDARTLNISTTGMAIVTDGPIVAGTTLTLRCHLLVNGTRSELITPVRVVHSVFSNSDGGFVLGLVFGAQSADAARLFAAALTVR